MKILLVGNDRFIAESLANRFLLEDDQVFILGEFKSGLSSKLTKKVKHYETDLESESCNDLFSIYIPDAVVYFDNAQRNCISDMVLDEVNEHVSRFMNIFSLASFHAIKKFIYISSIELYENTCVFPDEQAQVRSDNLWESAHSLCEQHILNMSLAGKISPLILRASTIYGPHQESVNSEISFYIDKIFNSEDHSIEAVKTDRDYIPRDYIFVDDFTRSVYLSTNTSAHGIMNIASGVKVKISVIKESIKKIYANLHPEIINKNIVESVDVSKAASIMDFVTYTDLYDGCLSVVNFNKQRRTKEKKLSIFERFKNYLKKSKERRKLSGFKIQMLIYLEILLMFAFVAYLTMFKDITMLFGYIDIRVLYILIVGAVHGMRQSSIAIGLCISLLFYEYITDGYDMLVLIYDSDIMAAIFVFLLSGMVLGYLSDRSKLEVNEVKKSEAKTANQLEHIKGMYYDSLRVKDSLQGQIFNSENSYGRVFGIVSSLDSLDFNKLKGEIIRVTEDIMENHSIALYMFGRNKTFLRLLSKSQGFEVEQKSIVASDSLEIQEMMRTKKIFINRDVDRKSEMLMAAPVVYDDEVIAIVAMHEAQLEFLTLSYQNLFSITMNLVNQSIVRAYRYQKAQEDEWYVEGTNLLKTEHLMEKISQSSEMQDRGVSNIVVIEVEIDDVHDYKEIVPRMIREFDHVGYDEKGRMLVLLNNTTKEEYAFVQKRFESNGVNVKMLSEVM